MEKIIEKCLESAMSYLAYKTLVIDLFAEGRSTSSNTDEALLAYSKLNISRVKRLDKTTKLTNECISVFKENKRQITWLVLSEGWCGDAAQNLPIINAVAELNTKIDLKIVLRDKHPELMNLFLTNGNESIPKLIQIENNKVVNTWGPRPTTATKMVIDYKEKHGKLSPEFKTDLQIWYNQNKGVNLLNDLINLIKQ